ncbi:MAG: 30S ribosomal protein S8 [Alphaproteobacteria bacterium GM202ARS2]|nr:30S ribosomal protein S8 [Alphaproteobacteria bacterium GM202ARS2]
MTISDPIADMLTRIRNGQAVHKKSVSCPSSTMRCRILDVLKQEGYIDSYTVNKKDDPKKPTIVIELRYHKQQGVIQEIKRISTPGCRVYAKIKDLRKVYGGLGVAILSTSQGILSDHDARKKGVGGEIICQVF